MISVKVRSDIIKIVDMFVECGFYPSRADFIREAIMVLLKDIIKCNPNVLRKKDLLDDII